MMMTVMIRLDVNNLKAVFLSHIFCFIEWKIQWIKIDSINWIREREKIYFEMFAGLLERFQASNGYFNGITQIFNFVQ